MEVVKKIRCTICSVDVPVREEDRNSLDLQSIPTWKQHQEGKRHRCMISRSKYNKSYYKLVECPICSIKGILLYAYEGSLTEHVHNHNLENGQGLPKEFHSLPKDKIKEEQEQIQLNYVTTLSLNENRTKDLLSNEDLLFDDSY